MAPDGDAGRHEGIDAMVRAALARHAAGDPTAKNDLLAHAQTQLQRTARRLLRGSPAYRSVGRWEQTDDVVQGLLMRMTAALDGEPIASPRDFFKIAAKHIHWELKALRERHLAKKRDIDKHHTDADDGGGDQVRGGEGKLEAQPARLDKYAAFKLYLDEIDTLSAADREILDLIFMHALTREEAADCLGLTLPTFKRRYRAALLRLRGHVVGDDGQQHG